MNNITSSDKIVYNKLPPNNIVSNVPKNPQVTQIQQKMTQSGQQIPNLKPNQTQLNLPQKNIVSNVPKSPQVTQVQQQATQLFKQPGQQPKSLQPKPLQQVTGGQVTGGNVGISASHKIRQVAVKDWIAGVNANKFDVLPFHNTGAFTSIPVLEKQKGDDIWEINRLLKGNQIDQNSYNQRFQEIEKEFNRRVEDKLLHQIPLYKLLNEHFEKMVYKGGEFKGHPNIQIPCKLNVTGSNISPLERYGMLEITFLKDENNRIGHAFLKPLFSEQNAINKYGDSGLSIWKKLNDIYYNTAKVGKVQDTHEGLDFTVTYLLK